MDHQEASKIIKEEAVKQKVVIKLTDEQLQALLEQWKGKDPSAPAEISFEVEGREVSNVKIAGYSYHGNSCCV